MRVRRLLIPLLYSISGMVFGQSGNKPMFHFRQENGLPSNTIYRMIQDRQGFIWIGTNAGVSRFNGHQFENYDRQNGLVDDEIVGMYSDSRERLWFLGITGRVCYYFKGKIYNQYNTPFLDQIRLGSAFLYAYEDHLHRIWFTSQTETLLLEGETVKRLSSKNFKPGSFLFEYNNSLWMMERTLNLVDQTGENLLRTIAVPAAYSGRGAIFHQKKESVWFASDKSFEQYRGNQRLRSVAHNLPKGTWFHDLIIESDTIAWVSTSIGLYTYNLNRTQSIPDNLLPNESCGGLLLDNENNLWIGTLKNGLWMLPSGSRRNESLPTLPEGNWNLVSRFKNKWVVAGSSEHSLLIETDQYNWKSLPVKEDIQQIFSGSENLWLVRNLKLHLLNPLTGYSAEVKSLSNGKISDLSSVKYIYFRGNETIITTNYAVFSLPDSIINKEARTLYANRICHTNKRIFSAYKDEQGKLWVYNSEGLFVFPKSKGTSSIFVQEEGTSIRGTGVPQILEAGKDTLLLATRGFGLLFLNKKGNLIQQISKKNGLIDAFCKKVRQWGNVLLVQTQGGLSVLNRENNIWVVACNLHPGNFSSGAEILDFETKGNQICILTKKGLIRLNSDDPVLKRHPAPCLFFESDPGKFQSGNDSTLLSDYGKPKTIHFQTIGFAWPQDIQYRYKISESEWNVIQQPSLALPLLNPGIYPIEIQARIGLGVWSKSLRLTFQILPEWWQHQLIQFGALIILIACLWYFMYLWFKAKRQKREERALIEKKLNDLEQQALLGLMNPHFVFNVMNAIQHFINSHHVTEANHYIAGFAKLIRRNLDLIRQKEICLEDEIALLQDYLQFEEMRFGEKAKAQILVDPDLDLFEIMIPVMMIQPFLENAIWHGVLTSNHPSSIELKIDKGSGNFLHVQITDTGTGIPEHLIGSAENFKGNKDHGLAITIERLKILCNKENTPFHLHFSYQNEELKTGTCVSMHLPFAS